MALNSLPRPALHEAGHVIAALSLGHFPRFVTLEPGEQPLLGTALGHTDLPRVRRESPAEIDRWAVIVAAGPEAEQRATGDAAGFHDEDELVRAWFSRCGLDARRAKEGPPPRGFVAWRRGIVARARRLLARPRARRAVAAVASALAERGTLRRKEILALAAV